MKAKILASAAKAIVNLKEPLSIFRISGAAIVITNKLVDNDYILEIPGEICVRPRHNPVPKNNTIKVDNKPELKVVSDTNQVSTGGQ